VGHDRGVTDLGPIDRAAARRLRETFLDAGFTADGLLSMLGASAYAALGRGEHVPARRALQDRHGAESELARLFVLGDTAERSDVARHLPLNDLLALGLVGGGATLRALVDVRPYGESDTDWYVVSDHGPDSAGQDVAEVAADHVLGVGGASLTLARLTPRSPVDRALDLGTGCGVQALHLGRHAGTVVATDRNRRALRLAAVTAALSGQRWDLREGSMFEPVAGETFDLVVSNPPFVISPGHRYTYRDAGLPADDLGRLLVTQAPARLADGGTAVILANWLHVRGEDWRERVATWVASTGCDAWVAEREVQDPAEYVGLWLRDAGGVAQHEHGDSATEGDEHDRRYAEWLDELRAMDADGIGFGWVVLHKGGTYGAHGPRVEDVATAPRQPRGDEVAALVAARAGWSTYDAFALLESRPRRAPALRLVEEDRADEQGRLGPMPSRVGLVDGWRPDVVLDSVGVHLVRRLDGATSLSDAIDSVAAAYDLDADDVLPGALLAVRGLVEDGLLVLDRSDA
jgi:methylase of polypeptide subunit release factors